MAFPTPEYALGQDLDGDGDTLDTVLRYQNLDTGQIVNTHLQVSNRYRDVDLYERTIAFMEQSPYPVGMIWLYDIDTGKARQTGVIGFHPTIHGHLLTASSDTVRYLDLDTNTFVDTGFPGTWLSVWGDVIAYQRQVQKGSAPDIRYYNVKTKEMVNTHASGWVPAIYENIITFATPESEIKQDLNGDGDTNDIVVRYYDINTQQTYNTGQVGNHVSIYGNRIVYSDHNEVYYYDIDTQQAFNTHRLGTEPDIYEGTISYYLWEKWATQDLNTDGDRQDPIVRTVKVSELDVATPSRTKAPILTIEPLSISVLLGYPNPVRLGQEVAFEAEGTGIKEVSVAVFDLAGQRVYESGFVLGNALSWNVLNDQGQPVANGVYLYVVTARGFDEHVILSRVKKLVVLR